MFNFILKFNGNERKKKIFHQLSCDRYMLVEMTDIIEQPQLTHIQYWVKERVLMYIICKPAWDISHDSFKMNRKAVEILKIKIYHWEICLNNCCVFSLFHQMFLQSHLHLVLTCCPQDIVLLNYFKNLSKELHRKELSAFSVVYTLTTHYRLLTLS